MADCIPFAVHAYASLICAPQNFDINSTFDQELLALAAASGLNNTPGPLEVIKAYGCSFVSFNCRDPDASGGLCKHSTVTVAHSKEVNAGPSMQQLHQQIRLTSSGC